MRHTVAALPEKEESAESKKIDFPINPLNNALLYTYLYEANEVPERYYLPRDHVPIMPPLFVVNKEFYAARYMYLSVIHIQNKPKHLSWDIQNYSKKQADSEMKGSPHQATVDYLCNILVNKNSDLFKSVIQYRSPEEFTQNFFKLYEGFYNEWVAKILSKYTDDYDEGCRFPLPNVMQRQWESLCAQSYECEEWRKAGQQDHKKIYRLHQLCQQFCELITDFVAALSVMTVSQPIETPQLLRKHQGENLKHVLSNWPISETMKLHELTPRALFFFMLSGLGEELLETIDPSLQDPSNTIGFPRSLSEVPPSNFRLIFSLFTKKDILNIPHALGLDKFPLELYFTSHLKPDAFHQILDKKDTFRALILSSPEGYFRVTKAFRYLGFTVINTLTEDPSFRYCAILTGEHLVQLLSGKEEETIKKFLSNPENVARFTGEQLVKVLGGGSSRKELIKEFLSKPENVVRLSGEQLVDVLGGKTELKREFLRKPENREYLRGQPLVNMLWTEEVLTREFFQDPANFQYLDTGEQIIKLINRGTPDRDSIKVFLRTPGCATRLTAEQLSAMLLNAEPDIVAEFLNHPDHADRLTAEQLSEILVRRVHADAAAEFLSRPGNVDRFDGLLPNFSPYGAKYLIAACQQSSQKPETTIAALRQLSYQIKGPDDFQRAFRAATPKRKVVLYRNLDVENQWPDITFAPQECVVMMEYLTPAERVAIHRRVRVDSPEILVDYLNMLPIDQLEGVTIDQWEGSGWEAGLQQLSCKIGTADAFQRAFRAATPKRKAVLYRNLDVENQWPDITFAPQECAVMMAYLTPAERAAIHRRVRIDSPETLGSYLKALPMDQWEVGFDTLGMETVHRILADIASIRSMMSILLSPEDTGALKWERLYDKLKTQILSLIHSNRELTAWLQLLPVGQCELLLIDMGIEASSTRWPNWLRIKWILYELNADPQKYELFYRKVRDHLLREMATLSVDGRHDALLGWLQSLHLDACEDCLDSLNQQEKLQDLFPDLLSFTQMLQALHPLHSSKCDLLYDQLQPHIDQHITSMDDFFRVSTFLHTRKKALYDNKKSIIDRWIGHQPYLKDQYLMFLRVSFGYDAANSATSVTNVMACVAAFFWAITIHLSPRVAAKWQIERIAGFFSYFDVDSVAAQVIKLNKINPNPAEESGAPFNPSPAQ